MKIEKMPKKYRIINQGVHCKIRSYGSGLIVGTTYTACLYANSKKADCRAEQTAECKLISDIVNGKETQRPTCVFDFTPEQTKQLKVGNAILEIYDTTTLQQMFYDDNYAEVRATSLTLKQ